MTDLKFKTMKISYTPLSANLAAFIVAKQSGKKIRDYSTLNIAFRNYARKAAQLNIFFMAIPANKPGSHYSDTITILIITAIFCWMFYEIAHPEKEK